MAKTNNQRFAEYYQRKKAGVEVPQCGCGRSLKGNLSQKRQLCTSCYKPSSDGRHQSWLKMSKSRGREVLQESPQQWNGWEVGGRAIAPNGDIGKITAINIYIDGSVDAIALFDDGTQDLFLLSRENCLISH
jgi:hypothetical protein